MQCKTIIFAIFIFSGFLHAAKRLLTNAAYLLVVISMCLTTTIVTGFIAFAAKYFEVQFGTDPTFGSILVGGYTVYVLERI